MPGGLTNYKSTNTPRQSQQPFQHRVIDFSMLLVSRSMPIVISAHIDRNVTWGPHWALEAIIPLRRLTIKGPVLCLPKALPIADFKGKWEQLPEQQQIEQYTLAHKSATDKLNKQKLKTGVAILGRPCSELVNDPKFQGRALDSAIEVGESMANTALTAELLILSVAEVPEDTWFSYLGRSQYPKLKVKSLCRSNHDYKTSCPDLDFWSSLRGTLARIKQDSTVDDSKWRLAEELHGNLSEIDNHLDKLTGQVSVDRRLTLACASTDIVVHNSKVLNDMGNAVLQQCSHALVAYWFKNFLDLVK